MQYRALYLENKKKFVVGDTVILNFILLDENDDIVTDLSGMTIKAEITNNGDEVKLDNASRGGITVSGSKITITIPSSETTDFDEDDYLVEIQVEKNSQIFTVYIDTFEYIEEELDW